ncbi:MAG: MBL fold metallo-hydrolase [Bacteroidetes bacterium]|nr:MBL fold metallo-hydrolase [Bacteroidota bacterium]MBS1630471.1 MBL fold metallo-hydrolase [Bacteroidota bacterium]
MIIRQLYTNCLSEAAYFIAHNGEAAVIDPLRDIDSYLELAREQHAQIKYIFETHFHADFVSGHVELAQATGATIVYGPGAETGFKFYEAKDGERFSIGGLELEVLHTPGHTLESSCYLLRDETGKPHCIFSGDTLFVGDVGRPDLFSGNLSKEELADKMYDSLQQKIKTLPDDLIVYPAHGPGSACGKALGKETYSTIGAQKAGNYALADMSRADFIKSVTEGLNEPPAYFPINARINKEGYAPMAELMDKGLRPLAVAAFKQAMEAGAWVLDTRNAEVFTQGFVPGSISIGLDGRFAEWAGSLLPFEQPLLLVTEPGKERESLTRLARVGLDKVEGCLAGGIEAWRQAGEKMDMIVDVEADELAMDLPFDQRLEVLDVRKLAEFEAGHVKGATHFPLSEMTDVLQLAAIDAEHNLYVHCAGGYRSVIACSLLKRQGFHNLRNVLGGWAKMKSISNLPLVKPTTA